MGKSDIKALSFTLIVGLVFAALYVYGVPENVLTIVALCLTLTAIVAVVVDFTIEKLKERKDKIISKHVS